MNISNYKDPNILNQSLITKGIFKKTKVDHIVTWVYDRNDFLYPHDRVDIFLFKPLKQIEENFLKSGAYSTKQIKKMMIGLSRLPGYANKTTNKNNSAV